MIGTMQPDDEEVTQVLQKSGLRTWIGVIAGFRFAQDSRYKGTLKGRIYWYYELFTEISITINAVTLFAVLLLPGVPMMDRLFACFPSVSSALCIFMSNYPRFKRRSFSALMDNYENAFSNSENGPQLERAIQKGAKHLRSISLCLLWLEFFPMVTCCVVLPLLNEATSFALGPRKMAVPAIWPWDPLASFWHFTPVVFFQMCGSVFVDLKKIAFEESFFIYASRQICLFKHLRYNLESIFDPLVVNVDGKVNMEGFSAPNRFMMKRKLVIWVKDHQNCLRLFKEFQTLYEWPLVVYFGSTILILCSATYVTSDNSVDFNSCVLCGVFTVGIFFELLCICRMGDLIKNETEELVTALSGKYAFLLNSEEFRYLKMIMTRFNCESIMRASGGFPLTISTFISITKCSYSYYTMLKEVNGKTN